MTFTELYQKYLGALWSAFQYDIEVFSMPWLYAWGVPITVYITFFVFKWVFLTFPVWGPFAIVFQFFNVLASGLLELRNQSLLIDMGRLNKKKEDG